MASFHMAVKTVGRSAGRSATAAAAYRAGADIHDERTGERHNYTRRGGVESAALVMPREAPEWDRAQLWNAAETAERRKNSTVAREFEVALPHELSSEDRRELAMDFAGELVERHGVAADVAIHAPGREGDHRNHHAHILVTTRRLGADGLGEKTRELDDRTSGEIGRWRERWGELQNERLRAAGVDERVDHRSLAAQGVEREAAVHIGARAMAVERRGVPTERGDRGREIGQHNAELARVRAAVMRAEAMRAAEPAGEQERAQVSPAEMSDAELREAMREAKPPSSGLEAAKDERVIAAAAARTAAKREELAARAGEREAARRAVDWRREHPTRAWMQDQIGVGGAELARLEAEREAFGRTAEARAERTASTESEWHKESRAALGRVEKEQAPARERFVELRRELRHRESAQERDRDRDYGFDR